MLYDIEDTVNDTDNWQHLLNMLRFASTHTHTPTLKWIESRYLTKSFYVLKIARQLKIK